MESPPATLTTTNNSIRRIADLGWIENECTKLDQVPTIGIGIVQGQTFVSRCFAREEERYLFNDSSVRPPRLRRNKRAFPVTAARCKWRYDATCMLVAGVDAACTTMMVTCNGERLDGCLEI